MGAESTTPPSTNLDLVRSIYADWERGDYSSADWANSEIEFVLADGPVTGACRGTAGLTEVTPDALGAWEGARIVPEDYRELDGKRFVVLVAYSGRGRTMAGSCAVSVEGSMACPPPRRQGDEVRPLLDRERAFADLGLASEGGSQR